MPMQHDQTPARNGRAPTPLDRNRWQREVEATTDAEPAPAAGRFAQEENRTGVGEVMNDHDQALQYQLVLLLSTLEQQRTQLEAALDKSDAVQVLDLARALVDEVVKVAERIDTSADSALLTNALADAGNLYTTFDRLRKDFDPTLLQSMLTLFGKPRTSAEQKRQGFRQTVLDTYRVVENCLSLFATQFQSAAAGREWAQASALFLHDLQRVVEKVNS